VIEPTEEGIVMAMVESPTEVTEVTELGIVISLTGLPPTRTLKAKQLQPICLEQLRRLKSLFPD
jgi:hypothetical protein